MVQNNVFLDSSVLIAALLSSQGGSFYILNQLKHDYQFQINDYVLREILEVLDKKLSSHKELKNHFFLLLGLAKIQILANPPESLVKKIYKFISKEDAPILASAILRSNYLITLDKEFLKDNIRNFANENSVIIVTPKEFLETYRKKNL